MLEIDNLSVSYGELEVVRHARLSVADGKVAVLIGPNGSGKTTLLRAICGLLPTTNGCVRVDGIDVTRVPTHKRGVGMLFQSSALFPGFDVAGNVAFGLRTVRPRLSSREIAQRVDDLLELVGMSEHHRDDVSSLSGGQARRVDIARVLAPRPRVLLLDEPTSMLDASTIGRVVDRVRSFVQTHAIATVCITHDVDEASLIGDTVLQFADIVE